MGESDPIRQKMISEVLVDKAYEREIICRSSVSVNDFQYALDVCQLEDFSVKVYRGIFWAMRELVKGGLPVRELSPLVVSDYLEARGLLNEVDGSANVEAVMTFQCNIETNITTVCNRLREKYAERRLIARSYGVLLKRDADVTSVSTAETIKELVASAKDYEDIVSRISRIDADLRELTGGDLEGALLFTREPEVNKLPCPFPSMDRILGGLGREQLIVVGGRPGMGKTSFAIHFAAAMALCPATCIVASYEMKKKNLVERLISQICEIQIPNIEEMLANQDTIPEREQLEKVLSKSQVWLDTDELKNKTVKELRKQVQMRKLSGEDVGLVIVDYLQIMNAYEPGDKRGSFSDRNAELTAISGQLKDMAKDLNCCVIALSQLSRSAKPKKNDEVPPRPVKEDLRESGAIEQNADKIILLHRPEYYIKGEVPFNARGLAEIIIDKNRYGSVGIVPLRWRGMYTSFSEMSDYEKVNASNWDDNAEQV